MRRPKLRSRNTFIYSCCNEQEPTLSGKRICTIRQFGRREGCTLSISALGRDKGEQVSGIDGLFQKPGRTSATAAAALVLLSAKEKS